MLALALACAPSTADGPRAPRPEPATEDAPGVDTAAPSEEVEPFVGDASFHGASDAQLRAALSAATGLATTYLGLGVINAELDYLTSGTSVCPTGVFGADWMRYTGGCTAPSGWSYEGEVEARNAGGALVTYDASADTEITATDFLVDSGYARWALEGTTTYTPVVDGAWDEHEALDVDLDGVAFAVDATTTCSDSGVETCGFAAGSWGEVPGLGSFGLAGERVLDDEAMSGWLELTGADTIRFDLDDRDDGCTPWTIGGTAGELCV